MWCASGLLTRAVSTHKFPKAQELGLSEVNCCFDSHWHVSCYSTSVTTSVNMYRYGTYAINGLHTNEKNTWVGSEEEHILLDWSIHAFVVCKSDFLNLYVQLNRLSTAVAGISDWGTVQPSAEHPSIHPSMPTNYALKLRLLDDHRLQLAVAIWCT